MDEEKLEDNYDSIKRLTDEELIELWDAYLADKTNKVLHGKIVLQYLYLTNYVVNRMKFTLPQSFEKDDIKSFAVEGLMDAVAKYEKQKGANFETYAILRIKGTVLDKLRLLDFLPRSVRAKIKNIKKTFEILRKDLGRYPTNEEVGDALGISKDQVDFLLSEESPIGSIYDKKFIRDDSIELVNTLIDPNEGNILEKLMEQDVKKKLQFALKKLPERERMVMVLYYHENMTLKEIGENICVSESRVCQIHASAIMKLRNILQDFKEERVTITQ